MSGLGVVGRDRYGVFPLKGKLLNVREATGPQVLKNEEIQVRGGGGCFRPYAERRSRSCRREVAVCVPKSAPKSHAVGVLGVAW